MLHFLKLLTCSQLTKRSKLSIQNDTQIIIGSNRVVVVLEDVYPLFSAFVKEEQFKELYEYATKEPFNALVIDATRGKPIFKKNFDKVLNIS